MQSKASFLYSCLSSTHAVIIYSRQTERGEWAGCFLETKAAVHMEFSQAFQGWLHGEITFSWSYKLLLSAGLNSLVPWSKKQREPWRLHFEKQNKTLLNVLQLFLSQTRQLLCGAHGCQRYRKLQTGREFPWFLSEWEGGAHLWRRGWWKTSKTLAI